MKKKMNSFKCFLMTLLSMVVLFVSSATVFASEPQLQQPEDPVIEGSYVISGYQNQIYYVTENNVYLRRNPSLSGERLGQLNQADGAWVKLTGEFSDANGIQWAQASESSLGYGGWVAFEYLGH